MPKQSYVIEFRYPEGVLYAGFYKGAVGWAQTLKTACIFDRAEDALRMLENGYGPGAKQYGYVVPIKAGP